MASRLTNNFQYQQSLAGTEEKFIELKNQENLHDDTKLAAEKPANDIVVATTESINERIYVLQNDIKLPLLWAEVVAKIEAMNRPAVISIDAWQDIKTASSQLARDNFGLLKLIINHEWRLLDIFGCDSTAPTTRFDMMGLILLLHQGDEVVGVNKQRIKIFKKSGSSVVFSKSLSPAGEKVLLSNLNIGSYF